MKPARGKVVQTGGLQLQRPPYSEMRRVSIAGHGMRNGRDKVVELALKKGERRGVIPPCAAAVIAAGNSSPGNDDLTDAVEDPSELLSPSKRGVLRIRRPAEMKNQQIDRFNFDRKQLTACPILEGEERLKLLNYQSNFITQITNMRLPSLVFLDLYNNNIKQISGLDSVPSLRVLMLGKNHVKRIEGLESIRRLDVLDLHNNEISCIENVSHLTELRVLNLAGNKLRKITTLGGLKALTEINLRRNQIEAIYEMDTLACLQRLFLSNNEVKSLNDVSCLFRAKVLSELTIDGNPLTNCSSYRQVVIEKIRWLKQLDLRRVSEEDRRLAVAHARREEEKMLEIAKREAAKSERLAALSQIQQTWCQESKTPNGGLTEYDASQHSLTIHGSGSNGVNIPLPDEATDFNFYFIVFDKMISRFFPLLSSHASLQKLTLSHNKVDDLGQLAHLSLLPNLKELTITNNRVVDSIDLLRGFVKTACPAIETLNGIPLRDSGGDDGQDVRFVPFAKLLSCTPWMLCRNRQAAKASKRLTPTPHPLSLKFPDPSSPSAAPSRKVASQYVKAMMTHASIIDSKIQLLNNHWEDIIRNVVIQTITASEIPPFDANL